jgi:hypothetical protein
MEAETTRMNADRANEKREKQPRKEKKCTKEAKTTITKREKRPRMDVKTARMWDFSCAVFVLYSCFHSLE